MIKHVGNCPERRNIWNPEEVVYADEWEKVNQNQPGTNGRLGYLEMLLNQFDDSHIGVSSISQRDAFVAATIIQWLGTNIGQCFIEQCEQKIRGTKPEFECAQKMAQKLK